MHATLDTLSADNRARAIAHTNLQTAAAIALPTQIKPAQCKVRGPGFIADHKLWDAVSTAVLTYSDILAKRAGGFSGEASGGVQAPGSVGLPPVYGQGVAHAKYHLCMVSTALGQFRRSVQDSADKAVVQSGSITVDPFTEVRCNVEQQWRLTLSHAGVA